MGFWLFAIALSLGVAALLARAVLHARRGAEDAAGEVPGIALYREQLAAVARDAGAGRVSPAEAARLELEIKRRILEADRAAKAEDGPAATPEGLKRGLAAALVLAVFAGAGGLYWRLGAPGYPDLPHKARIAAAEEFRAGRPDQAEMVRRIAGSLPATPDPDASAEFLELMARLRAAVAERPGDLQGHELLARNEAALGNYTAAAEAQRAAIRIKGPGAVSNDHLLLAQLLVAAAQGYVSPEAEAALRRALELNENNLDARYYWGLMHAQTGRPDLAFRIWRALVEQGPPEAPWMDDLRGQIGAAARDAGVDYTLPPARGGRGPSMADVEAAGELSPEERQEMVRGMVDGLSDRLATEGGPAEDWARLIRALGVLGETDRARAIVSEAREVFAGDATGLAGIEAAARAAGVGE